jgi:putative nucleotidyltransferase with HDIG domain
MMSKVTPEQVKARIGDLPPLAAVVTELIASMGSDTLSSEELAAKLSMDPALSAKTLRMANSSFYGLSRQIESVHDAVTVLGLRTVRTLVVASGITGNFKVPATPHFDFRRFWRHAVGTALCGQTLARELSMDSDIGFTVGLLHDIGQVALACCFPDEYAHALAYQQEHDVLLVDAERTVLGTDHAAIGGQISELWRFSPAIVEAIAYHHAPAMHHGPGLVGLTHMADSFSHALGLSGQQNEAVPITSPEIWQAMSPGQEACMSLFAKVECQFDGVCQALQV